MELFGFQIKRKKSEEEENKQPNPLRIVADVTEPADEISSLGSASGFFATAFDDGSAKITNERELIIQYRTIAEYPEVDLAVNEIVNEAISFDDNDSAVVDIRFDEYDGPKNVREKIVEAFDDTVQLMKLNNKAAELFQRWYIDGRLYFYITPNKEKTDIESVVQLSPFSIRKKREIIKETDPKTRVEFIKSVREYYEYDPSNSSADDKTNRRQTAATKLELTPDSVVAVTSGIRDIHSKVYLSYLHKAIKVANNLRSLEDSLVVYRISRAPERRIFYIDVGNLQKGKADEYMKSIMNRHRNKIVYNSKTGEITSDKNHMSILEDFWLPRREGRSGTEISTLPGGCLAMDTKVSLLDGRELSIRDIEAEMNEGKSLWTYSCHPKTGAIIPGKISWAGVTQKSAEVMKITLDNGETITCTPDHKFPIYNKGFVEATDLKEDDSLIPLYRNKKNINCNESALKHYEQFFNNADKKWYYTHRMVADYFKDNICKHWNYHYENSDYEVRHHIDHNKFNNSPENLCWMSWRDHQKYHSDHAGWPEWAAAEGGNAFAQKLKFLKENCPEEYRQWSGETGEIRRENHAKIQKVEFNEDMLKFVIDLVRGKSRFEITLIDVTRELNNSEEMLEMLYELNKDKSVPNWNINNGFTPTLVAGLVKSFGYDNWRNFRKTCRLQNHRIVKIEYLDEEIEVGTLTIDNEYHTFALSSGVFTKNSNLGEIEDLLYMQRKLFRSLNVPIARLEQENQFSFGRVAEISRDEVKFQKFISRLRRNFAEGIIDVLQRVVVIRNIMSASEFEEIRRYISIDFLRDNFFSQLKELEIMRERAQLVNELDTLTEKGFVSNKWIRTKVLRQTEEDIKEIDKEREKEKPDEENEDDDDDIDI
jgi:hypothetical protein